LYQISQPLVRDLVGLFNCHKGGRHDRREEHNLERRDVDSQSRSTAITAGPVPLQTLAPPMKRPSK